MKKKQIYMISAIFGIMALLLIIPIMINWNKYESSFIKRISETAGINVEIDGKVKVRLFPLPKFEIEDIRIKNTDSMSNNNLMTADIIYGNISILSLLQGKILIKSLMVENANFFIEVSNHKNNFDMINNHNLDYITFTNSYAQLKYNKNIIHEFKDINISLNFGSTISLDGDLNSSGQKLFITAASNKNKDNEFEISADIKSDVYTAKINGNRLADGDKKKIVANVVYQVFDHDFFTHNIVKVIPSLSYLMTNKFDKPIDISSTLELSSNSFSLKDIIISSKDGDSLKGKGSIYLDLDTSSKTKINFDFDKIDIDKILNLDLSTANGSSVNNSENLVNMKYITSNDSDIKIDAKHIIFKGKSIEDFSMMISINEAVASIDKLNAKMPDNMLLNIQDLKASDDGQSIFGHIKLSGDNLSENIKWYGLENSISVMDIANNYDVEFDLKIQTQDIYINNLNGKIADGNIKASWRGRFGEDRLMFLSLDLDSVNLYNISLPNVHEIINNLTQDTGNPGYLAKYKFVRDIKGKSRYKINFNNCNFQEKKLNKFSAALDFAPSNVKIGDINIDSDFLKINGELSMDSSQFKPNISINLNGDIVDIDAIKNIWNNTIIETLTKKNDSSQIDSSLTDSESKKIDDSNNFIWSKNNFSFIKFNNFTGNILAKISRLVYSNNDINNIDVDIKLDNDSAYFSKLNLTIFSGDVDIRGSISLAESTPSLQISFGYSNFLVGTIAKLLKLDDYLTGGRMSISGSLYTSGNSPYEWADKANSELYFAGRGITIEGINIGDVIDIVSMRVKTDKDKAIEKTDIALNNGASMVYSIDGKLNTKDGLMSTQDVTFSTYFANGSIAASMNINDLALNYLSKIAITPKIDVSPIVISVHLEGNINRLKRTTNSESLVTYLQEIYLGIKPNEDAKEKAKHDLEEFFSDDKTL